MQSDIPMVHSNEQKIEFLSIVDTLDLKTGEWKPHCTTGNPPLGVYASCCTPVGKIIYFFGGHCGHENCYHNSLHMLDTSQFQWNDANFNNSHNLPMKKGWCGMVSFKEDNLSSLCVVGGLGILPEKYQEHQYTPDELDQNFGWTNEIHIFSIENGNSQ